MNLRQCTPDFLQCLHAHISFYLPVVHRCMYNHAGRVVMDMRQRVLVSVYGL